MNFNILIYTADNSDFTVESNRFWTRIEKFHKKTCDMTIKTASAAFLRYTIH